MRLGILVLSCLVPMVASANVLWKADFETGDRSQFDVEEIVAEDRMRVVDWTVREGRYVLRAMVKLGDDPINASGNRNELVKYTGEKEGQEFYYSFSTYFPDTFPSSPYYQLFFQWHHDGCCGSPPVSLYVQNDQFKLQIGGDLGRVVWMAPMTRSVWNDFVIHVKWSSDPTVGFIEVWRNRERELGKTYGVTLFPGTTNYLKVGLYRDERITADAVVFHDAVVKATTLDDVLPPAPVVEPTPTEPTPTDPPPTSPGTVPPPSAGPTSPWPASGEGEVEVARMGCSAIPTRPFGFGVLLIGVIALVRRRRSAP